MPHPFLAVGESYWDFSQVSDEEVRELLATPTTPAPAAALQTRPIRFAASPSSRPTGFRRFKALDKVIGDARIVLIGEGSHGTHEFYQIRAEITNG